MSRRFEGAHEISVHELNGCIRRGWLSRGGQLMPSPYRTYVTVRNRTVKCDPITVRSVYELQAALVKVTQPPMPHLSIAIAFIASSFPAYSSALRSSLKE